MQRVIKHRRLLTQIIDYQITLIKTSSNNHNPIQVKGRSINNKVKLKARISITLKTLFL